MSQDEELLQKLENFMHENKIEIYTFTTPFVIRLNGREYIIFDKESLEDSTELPRCFDSEILKKYG